MLFKIITLLLLISNLAVAQHQAGINYDNFAAPVTTLSNPANLGSSKLKIGINIINAEAQLFNNYARWNAPFSFISFFTGSVSDKYQSDRGLIVWKESYTKTKENLDLVEGAATIAINGPAILYNFTKINLGVQAGLNIKGFGSFANTSEEIGRHIVKIRPVGLYDTDVFDNQALINIGYYKEAYLSLGKTVYDQNSQRIKVGLTGKFLTSSNFLGLNAESVDYQVSESPADDRQSRTQFNKAEGLIYFVQDNSGINAASIAEELIKINSPGRGYAGSIGFIYEFRPDYIKHSRKFNGKWIEKTEAVGYKFRAGVSVEDVGYLRYSNANVATVQSNTPVIFDNDDFKDNSAPQPFFDLVESKFALDRAAYIKSFSFLLPSRIHGFIDYKYDENKFVTAFVNTSLYANNRTASAASSSVGVVPRYETKRYAVSVPILMLNDFRTLTFGLSGRIGGFFLGTNHVPGFFNFTKTRGASIYGGLFVPFFTNSTDMKTNCDYPEDRKKKSPIFRKRWR